MFMEEPQSFAPLEDSETYLFILDNISKKYAYAAISFTNFILSIDSWIWKLTTYL